MGAGLVALVLMRRDLTPNGIRVLARMALTALDSDEEPVYWGGWPFLATAGLGYPEYSVAAKRAVQRAVRELVEAKAIERLDGSGPRQNAAYRLSITFIHNPQEPVENA